MCTCCKFTPCVNIYIHIYIIHVHKYVACYIIYISACVGSPAVTLQHTATHCNTLQHTATHCNTLQDIATHCNTLRETATHYDILQHTAYTLQDTARRCKTLQHTEFKKGAGALTRRRSLKWGRCYTRHESAHTHAHRQTRPSRTKIPVDPAKLPRNYVPIAFNDPVESEVLQRLAASCSVLPWFWVCCSVLPNSRAILCSCSQRSCRVWSVAACCSVLQRAAVCCIVLQCVALCRSVSQRE